MTSRSLYWSSLKPSKKSRPYGGGFCLIALAVFGGAVLMMPFVQPEFSLSRSWLLEFSIGLSILTLSWRFVNKANERAAAAIQAELDALDEPSTPQSV